MTIVLGGTIEFALEKMRRAAARAASGNPYTLPPLAKNPDYANSTQYYVNQMINANGNAYVCWGTGVSASSGTGPSSTSGLSIADGTALFRYMGKARTTTDDPQAPSVIATGNSGLRYARFRTPVDNPELFIIPGIGASGTGQGPVTFDAHTDLLSIETNNSGGGFRLLIDGREWTDGNTGLNTGGMNNFNVRIQFPDFRCRRVTFESYYSSFLGASVPSYGRITKPDMLGRIKLVGLGSSIEAGSAEGPHRPYSTYLRCMAHLLGWDDPVLFPIGGSGYLQNGSLAKYRTMFTTYSPASADVVFIGGPYNDQASNLTDLYNEAVLTLQTIRAKYSLAFIFVSGCWNDDSSSNPALTAAEETVFSAVDALNDPLIFKIPMMTDPTGTWVNGTGRLGSENNSGNSDILTGTDGTHPTNAAHYRYLPKRFASAIREIIENV